MVNLERPYIAELPGDPSQTEVGEDKGHYGSDNAEKDSSPLDECDLDAYFSSGGVLSGTMADYELRPGQLEMANVVKQAILDQCPALIEAPTGTGKSLAYLLPAVLSERKVVVATANKSLQDQLFRKDIPFLRNVLGRPIDAIVVKGRNNFICSHKWERDSLERSRLAFLDKEDQQVASLRQWLAHTDTGDIDDLEIVLKSDLRPRVVSFPDDCIGRVCSHFEDNCFVNQMREKARQAQVVITNHHLLLNALELGEMGQVILPEAAVYIIDEAHQLEDTATSVFEVETSDYALMQLLSGAVFKDHVEEEVLFALQSQNQLAFSEVDRLSKSNVFRIDTDLEALSTLAGSLTSLQDEMRKANPYSQKEDADQPPLTDEESEEEASYDLAVKGLGSLAGKMKAVSSSSQDDLTVRYAERIKGSRHLKLRLHAAPVDPSHKLARYLFEEEGHTVVCTSATLATNGSFDHFRSRCGVKGVPLELISGSVFNYSQQALLYQPALPAFDWRNKDPFLRRCFR